MTEDTFKSLKDKLVHTIKKSGPLTLAHYMADCLGDKTFGYYMVENPFGAKGDFITAPEVSQMFGEGIGLMLLDFWMKNPSADPINLVELGPGQGTLMADVLRVLSMDPKLKSLLSIHFIEMSPRLKAKQAEKVPVDVWGTTWHEHLGTLPEGKTWFIANEFFDALPAHQFQKTEKGWVERSVGLDTNDNLTLIKNALSPAFNLMDETLKKSAKTNDIVEICPDAFAIMDDISNHIKNNGGIATIIDYGYGSPAVGDTLQAMKNHKFTDILDQPGKQDLTTHVNFAALSAKAKKQGLKSLGPVFQGEYLLALGMAERAKVLIQSNDEKIQENIIQDLNRLTSSQEMGELFKVLVVVDGASTIPAPFSSE